MADNEQALGFHAWNEVVLHGRGVPVEASGEETDLNPSHLGFGVVLGDPAVNLLAALNQLSFRVVERRAK